MPIFGNSIYASTIVVATFMAGLALGGGLGGRYADKIKSPLLIFAVSQFLIGIYAFFIPESLSAVKTVYIYFAVQNEYSLHYLNAIRGLSSFLSILFPASLMGMAIPILIKEISHRSRNGNWSIGSVYSISSFGGAIGCFLAGFLLIMKFGIEGSNYFAASISIAVSVSAFALWIYENIKKTPCLSSTDIFESTAMQPVNIKTIYALIFLVFISGFTALGYEILWMRLLIPVLESTIYTFSLILSVFLLGLGLGNYLCFKLLNRSKKILFYVVIFEIAIGVYAIFSIALFPHLISFGRLLYGLADGLTWENTVFIKFILVFTFLVFPTTLFGMILPLVSSIYSGHINKIGKGAGSVFSVNMVGSIIGSVLAGFVFLPTFGVQNSLIIFGLINISVGLIVFISGNSSRKAMAVIGSSLICIFFVTPILSDTRLIEPMKGEELVYYKEGISGNVEVSNNAKGYNILRVDNKTHGGNEPWVKTDEVRIAHFPMFLHHNPKNILLIGLGTGITLDAVSRHNINSVDCVEIVKELKYTLDYFFSGKPKILKKKNVNIIIEDGRNYILRTGKQYDIIIMDLVHPESPGTGSLFTKEYYEEARAVIKQKGFVAQWLPLYQLSMEELKIIMRTFASTFPYTSLWFGGHNMNFPIVMLAGSMNKLSMGEGAIKHRLDSTELSRELYEKNDARKFLDNFIISKKDILKYTEGASINTDDYPIIEFLTPRGLLQRSRYGRENYAQLIRVGSKM